MSRPQRIAPGPGEESVWDYPRPPRLEPVAERLRIEHAGRTIADAPGGWRVLETSHPPVYYLAPEAFAPGVLQPSDRTSFCEFKGRARYYDLLTGTGILSAAAWAYPLPSPAFAPIAHAVAVYASRVDAAYVGDERVAAQPGDFYGGWITSKIVGPFKGGAGSWGW